MLGKNKGKRLFAISLCVAVSVSVSPVVMGAEKSVVGTMVTPEPPSELAACITSPEWKMFSLLTDEYVISAVSQEKEYLYAIYNNMVSMSADGGETFRILAEFEQPQIDSVHMLNEILFVCTSNGRYSPDADAQLFRSDDYGETFQKVLDVDAGSFYEWSMDVASDGTTMYASEYGYKSLPNNASKIYKSVDSGLTWLETYDSGDFDNGHFHRIHADAVDPNVVYQAVGDGFNNRLIKSIDAGETWMTIVPNFNPTSVVQVDDRLVWGTDTHPLMGFYIMENDAIIDEFPFYPTYGGGSIYDMTYANGMIFAATMSYAWEGQDWNSILWCSKDNGDTWEVVTEFEKYGAEGIGVYEMNVVGNTLYLNAGINVYSGLTLKTQSFRGTVTVNLDMI